MKKQLEVNTKRVDQHTADQKLMAKQIARLTLAQMRLEQNYMNNSDTTSEVLEDLKEFRCSKSSKQCDQEAATKTNLPKQHVPKVFYPKFIGDNLVVWKDTCVDYFLLVDLDPKHWVRMAAVHFDGVASQWLQVYKRKCKNPSWLQL
jgi:hypothetical protein